jgi:GWxTD domain-containing protein
LGRWCSPLIASGEKRIPVFQDISLPEVSSGEYNLEFYLFSNPADTSLSDVDQLRSHAALFASRRVTIELGRGIPIGNADVDEAIDQVDLIATGAESDSLRAAKTLSEKRKALADFWRRRNPDPGSRENRVMEVFYRRVQYANETFANPSHGWRSDRGRTYIVLGAPTTVDRHPYEVNQKPYEIWYYNDLNTRYVFVDEYMLGDYRLASAPAPTGMFLWQRDSY